MPARRPGVVLDLAARRVDDLRQRLVGDLHDVDAAVLVAERDPRPVRRPGRRVAERLAALRERLRLAGAVLRDDVELVLARHVGHEGDAPAVRRPPRPLVVRPRRARQVARRPLLDRRGEDVAARREQRPLPFRAQLDVADLRADRDAAGPARQTIVGHRDGDRRRLAALRVEQLQLAVGLVDDAPRLGVLARPAHVPRRGRRDGRRRLLRDVVGVEVEGPVAIGVEVDRAADPHRVAIGARVIGDPRGVVAGQVEDEQVVGLAAAVALLRAEVAEARRVDDPLAVRRVGSGARFRHRQRLGRTARRRDRVEPGDRQRPPVAMRPEQDARAVGRPAVHLVVVAPAGRERPARRVERELARLAARARHDVDLLVAVVLAGEREPLAVRREPGEQLQARMRRQARRGAAAGRRPPTGRRRA